MAATGMGGGSAWIKPARRELEALALEAVKLAVELVVTSMPSTPTAAMALDGAKASGYESVVQFLVDKGARSNGVRRKPASQSPTYNLLFLLLASTAALHGEIDWKKVDAEPSSTSRN